MPQPPRTDAPGRVPVRLSVRVANARAHLYEVRLRLDQPAAGQKFAAAVWIPGSYLVREFSKSMLEFTARQGRRALTVEQLDKRQWQVNSQAGRPLELRYQVVASDPSVRSAWLDMQRGFFNGTSLFVCALGHEDQEHEVEVLRPVGLPDWKVATALPAHQVDDRGFGRYRAADYNALVDAPFELGAFVEQGFKLRGVPHRVVVSGAPASLDLTRLTADTRRVCAEAMQLWHPRGKPAPPRYLFLLNAMDDDFGGLEHGESCALLCGRRDLPHKAASLNALKPGGQAASEEGYRTLLGLISHEYFHLWNIKRLRPSEFSRYDYARENPTRLLWFFEGFTSYYDELLLRRAGLYDDRHYLRQLGKTINQLHQTPGRRRQSVAQASFEAWTKFYRPDDNTPNVTVNYYGKGALVALCLDLSLRQESAGRATLDEVMRGLWRRCRGGPLTEEDILAVMEQVGGRSYKGELARWVHGTDELPLRDLLTRQGVVVHDDPAPLAQTLGLRVSEGQNGLFIKTVLGGSAAEAAGMMAGDEWLAVDEWRLGKLDDLAWAASADTQVQALVARDRRLLRLPLSLPARASCWRLAVGDAARLHAWLERASAT